MLPALDGPIPRGRVITYLREVAGFAGLNVNAEMVRLSQPGRVNPDLLELTAELGGESSEPVRCGLGVEDFLAKGLAPRTAQLYLRVADRVARLLAERGTDLTACTPANVAAVAQRFPSRSSRVQLRGALARAWEALGRQDPPPLKAVRLPPQPRRRSMALDHDIAARLEAAASELIGAGDRRGLAVLFGLYSGLRRLEIARARWDRVDLDHRETRLAVRARQRRPRSVRADPPGARRSPDPLRAALRGMDLRRTHHRPRQPHHRVELGPSRLRRRRPGPGPHPPAAPHPHHRSQRRHRATTRRAGDRPPQPPRDHRRLHPSPPLEDDRGHLPSQLRQDLPGGAEPDRADTVDGFSYRCLVEALEAEDAPAWIDLGVTLAAAGWRPKLVHDGIGPSLWWAHPTHDELTATASIDHRDSPAATASTASTATKATTGTSRTPPSWPPPAPPSPPASPSPGAPGMGRGSNSPSSSSCEASGPTVPADPTAHPPGCTS